MSGSSTPLNIPHRDGTISLIGLRVAPRASIGLMARLGQVQACYHCFPRRTSVRDTDLIQGKSTLMNFISDDKRTSSILKSWTGDRKLVCPKFFFWSPGSSLMKSFTGLLRALLYQILSQYQELQPLIYEQVIASLPFGDQQNEFSPKWKPGKLRDCLHTLLNQQQIPLKFCFFIDGLDEFEGERTDLLQFALDTASFPGVKMCLSSRPWPVFHKALDNFPKLALQDLTWKDIKMYVTDKMNSGLLLHGTDTLNAEHAQSLIDEIVFKANGVFLWVKLAVQSLLAGLEGEDCFPELRARLERTPPEVDDLYRHMLSQIDTSHRTQALRLFRLTLEADPPDKNFLEIALAYRLWASNCQWDLSELSTTVGEAIRDCELLLKHIPARTAGLLEIIPGRRSDDDSGYSTSNTSSDSDDSEEHADSKPAAGTNGLGNFKKMQVEFLHRILYDFISKELDHLEDVEPTKFDVVSALQVIILAYVTLKQLSYTCETWGNGLCLIGQSSFTEGFVTHALKLKTQTGEVPENLLDLFCQTAPDKEDDLCRPRYLNEACAVLVLAEYGLTCYVRKKLESWPFNSNQSLRIALLYHLVDGLVRDVVNPSGMPGIVRRLFEQDSDPNALDSEAQQMRLGFKKKAPHQSPWNILLSRIAGAYEIGTDDVTVASHSAILQLFIGAHANPNESVGLKISLFGVNNKRIQVHMDCSALNIFSSVQGRYRPSAAVMRALCYSGGRNERVYTSVSCGKDDYRLNQREDNYRLDQGESQLLVALIDGMRPPYIEYRESFQREGLELFSVGSGFRVEGEDFEGEDELTKFSYEVANILHNRKPEKYPAPKLEDGNLSIPGAEIEESSAS